MKYIKKIIQIADKLLTFLILLFFLPVLFYGIYVLWDSQQLHNQAETVLYETYKPDTKDQFPFSQLQDKNPEVFGWLTIKGTHMDYPLVQGENNSKYVNTDVNGDFSLSGAIFLDCRNQKNFSNLNHILYGHHMADRVMFGELESYQEPSYFEQHLEGSLYYEEAWHKVEFFAFLHANAYDSMLYNTALTSRDETDFLNYIKKHATNYKDLAFQGEEKFLTLSTCTSTSTNGRYLLIGKITEEKEKTRST